MCITIEKLINKKQDKKNEFRCRNLAISLDICPTCGANMIREDKEVLDKPIKYLFGLITKYTYTWSYRKVCSLNKAHFEIKRDYYNNLS